MNEIQRILTFREGGRVTRAHTFPHIGHYDVAQHSYNALSLLLLLYPKGAQPSLGLIKAVLWHDVPERWTGDVPAPAKWASPELKDLLDALEEKVLEKLDIPNLFKVLTQEEKDWLLGVDLLELYIWSVEQGMYGNKMSGHMTHRVWTVMQERQDRIPEEIIGVVKNFYYNRNLELHEILGEQDANTHTESQ